MSAYSYEWFIKNAFGVNGGEKDPAGLAEADIYSSSTDASLNEVKIGTGYAFSIYNYNYKNQKQLRGSEDFERMDQFLDKILSATSKIEISNIIEEYKVYMEELNSLNDLGDM